MNTSVEPKARVVAIVGRPNVGKSAVFNRIAGRRIAIVHDQSGVTRDRLIREVMYNEERLTLVDTGGVNVFDKAIERNAIEAGIRAQVDMALADAAVVILTVDVLAGIHPADAEVARLVHQTGLPCFIAVNKCDLAQHENGFGEFCSLGFPAFPVSALHAKGFENLMEAVIEKLPPFVNDTLGKPLRVAVVGRPNAGKSSFINRLLHSDRVIVSDVAGTTRDSIEIPFSIGSGAQARHYTLIDTAGMRHVHKIDNAVERFSLFRAEETIRNCDVAVIVMDSEIGPTTQDKYISSLIQKENKACVLLLNKWDLMEEKGITQTKAEPVFRDVIPFLNHCPLIFMSTKTGYNVRKSIEVIDDVAAQTQTKLPTGILNRTIELAFEKAILPTRNGKRLKIYYSTQSGTAPIFIKLFVNDPKLATKQFSDHIVHRIRDQFGLSGAPVMLSYRARPRPEAVELRKASRPKKAPIHKRNRRYEG